MDTLSQTCSVHYSMCSVAVMTMKKTEAKHVFIYFTWWVTKQDPCNNNHFKGFGWFACKHEACRDDGDEAVPDQVFFSAETRCQVFHFKLPGWQIVLPNVSKWPVPLRSSPSKPPWEELNADGTEESTDSVHGYNEGPYHGDRLWRRRLVVSLTPAAVDELLNKLRRWVQTWVLTIKKMSATTMKKGFVSLVRENSVLWCGNQTESCLPFPRWWWGAERCLESEVPTERQRKKEIKKCHSQDNQKQI